MVNVLEQGFITHTHVHTRTHTHTQGESLVAEKGVFFQIPALTVSNLADISVRCYGLLRGRQ